MTKTTAQYRLLGEILVDDGVITQGQLDEALSKQAQTAGFLGQALVDMGYIDEQSLSSILAKHCRIPYLSLLNYLVDEELLVVVPKELCLKHKMLPIDRLSDNLTLAIVDPMNEAALAEVRAACPDLKIKPVVCDLRHFRIVAERLFGETGDRAAPVESTEPNVAQETPGGASPQEPAAATAPKRAADEEASAPAKPAAEGLGESADAEGNPAATRAAPGANVVSIIEGSMRDTYEMLSRKVPLFSGIEPAFVAAIFGSGMTKEIEAGTAVFAQGELSSELYVILAGEVQIRDGDRVIESPGFRVAALDTTGAGDVFHAAFIWGLLEGLSVEAVLRAANAAAALSCQALGAQGELPDRKALEAFLESQATR